MARDGQPGPVEHARVRQPPIVERKAPENGPGGFTLEFSPEARAAIGEGATVRQHERGVGPGEVLVGYKGAVRWCLLRQWREDTGRSIEDVSAAALMTPGEVEAIEAGSSEAEGDRERARLSAAVGGTPDQVFPWRRWRRSDFTLTRPTYTSEPERPAPEPVEPQDPTLPPRRGGTPAVAREEAAERHEAETEALAAGVKRLRDDLTLSEAEQGMAEVRAEIAAKSKTPLQHARDRLRRRGR